MVDYSQPAIGFGAGEALAVALDQRRAEVADIGVAVSSRTENPDLAPSTSDGMALLLP